MNIARSSVIGKFEITMSEAELRSMLEFYKYLDTTDETIREFIDGTEAVLEYKKQKVFRVSYYTMQGGRVKDFGTDELAARRFYNSHVKNHPEYQHHSRSRTEIVSFDR